MKRADIPYTIKTTFDAFDIFRGAAIQLSSDDVRSTLPSSDRAVPS